MERQSESKGSDNGGNKSTGLVGGLFRSKAEAMVILLCGFLILLHFVASFFPRMRLWGISQLHYFSLEFRLLLCLVGLLILFPRVLENLIALIQRAFAWVVHKSEKLNRYLLYSAISLLSLIPFWFFRAKTPLLGDGYLRGGELKFGQLLSITEPLDFYLHLFVFRVLGWDGYTTYTVLSCLAGVVYVFLVLLLCDIWGRNGREKAFAFFFLISLGSIQLFFGYIESYSLMFAAMMAYIVFSLRYLKGESGFLWPCIFLLLSASFHLSALFVLPSLIYLALAQPSEFLHPKAGRIRFNNVIIMLCMISLVVLGLFLLKTYSPEGTPGSFLIYPLGEGDSLYSFFSPAHLLDFLNHQLLVSPVSLVIWVLLLLFFRKSLNLQRRVVRFLLWLTLGSIAFALLVDPKLGYARDWDLFAFAGMGISLLGLYLFIDVFRTKGENGREGKERIPEFSRMALVLVVTSFIFTVPWIWINTSQSKSVARLEDLLKLDERRAAHGYETLACYFRDEGETQRTIEFWKRAIAIDPLPRYYAALGNAYSRRERYDLAVEAYDRSLKLDPYGPANYMLYRSLGLCLAREGRFDEAAVQLKKAIKSKPNNPAYHYNLASVLAKAGRYEEAVPYYMRVLELDPNSAVTYRSLGLCYAHMGKKEEAERYLERYLKLNPKDALLMEGIIDSIQIEIDSGR
jgi:Tfp pilus assembly protein PilF